MWVLTYKGEGLETLVEFLSFEHLDLIEASQAADRQPLEVDEDGFVLSVTEVVLLAIQTEEEQLVFDPLQNSQQLALLSFFLDDFLTAIQSLASQQRDSSEITKLQYIV